jgi:hypothetical protein
MREAGRPPVSSPTAASTFTNMDEDVAKLHAGGAKADVFFPTIDVLARAIPYNGSVGFPNSHERLR